MALLVARVPAQRALSTRGKNARPTGSNRMLRVTWLLLAEAVAFATLSVADSERHEADTTLASRSQHKVPVGVTVVATRLARGTG